MDKFSKITVGFVTQAFERDDEGRFVCARQQFIAGDQCDYEDSEGNPIEPPDYEYQPYNMTLRTETEQGVLETTMLNRVYEAIEEVLDSLDVGGEQSRQFAEEIGLLREVIGHPGPVENLEDEMARRELIVGKLRRLAIDAEGLTASLPTLPVAKWLDGTVADATVDVYFEEYDLSRLLQFIADVGVSQES